MARVGRTKGLITLTSYLVYDEDKPPKSHRLSSVDLPPDVSAPSKSIALIHGFSSGLETLSAVRRKVELSQPGHRVSTISVNINLGEVFHGNVTPANLRKTAVINLDRANRKAISEIEEVISPNLPIMFQDNEGGRGKQLSIRRLDILEQLLGHPEFPEVKVVVARIPDLYMEHGFRNVALFKETKYIESSEARGLPDLKIVYPRLK